MPEINGWMSIADPYANLIFAGAGWDSVTLDAQHGMFDDRAVTASLMALAGKTPKRLVRVPWAEPALLGRALDAGADGVIAPLINSAEEARRLAAACWYPPRGARSFGPGLAALRAGSRPYADAAAEIEVWAMVETRAALESVEDIAAVDGVTGLFIGPNDLALSLGLGAGSDREEETMLAAFRRIVDAADACGKRAGIFCVKASYARRMGEFGFGMVVGGVDTVVFGHAAAAAVSGVRG